jgi:hypothetical protein
MIRTRQRYPLSRMQIKGCSDGLQDPIEMGKYFF